MRNLVRTSLCALFVTVPFSVSAGLAQDDMVHVIANLDLERGRAEAQLRCAKDAPAFRELMKDPVVSQYCVLRHGAPRKVGMLVGVRLSAELEDAGMKKQSDAIEALMDAQERRP